METVEVRPAHPEECPAVAGLRWRWELETGATPAIDRESFVDGFADWALRHADSHRCIVAARGGTVLGMAWLAVLARVPTPGAMVRANGDLQSVYLVPEARNGGLGGRLVAAVLAEARALGLAKVTVQSGTRAVPVYVRSGFAVSPKLLVAEVPAR